MNKKNIIIATVAIFAIAVLVGGVFWLGKKKTAPIVTEPKKEFTAVEGEDGWVWYPVPELGIEIKVNKDIAPELVYQVKKSQTGKDVVSAQFTTKRLLDIGEKSGLKVYEDNGSYTCNTGSFTRYNMSQEELEALSEYEYIAAHGVSVDGVFVVYNSPQSTCSYGPYDNGYTASDREYEDYVHGRWWKDDTEDLKGSLQQSIRKLK